MRGDTVWNSGASLPPLDVVLCYTILYCIQYCTVLYAPVFGKRVGVGKPPCSEMVGGGGRGVAPLFQKKERSLERSMFRGQDA